MRRRHVVCGDILDALEEIDFSPKYFVFRKRSEIPLTDTVFASAEEAQAVVDRQDLPSDYEVYGPVEFATSKAENWWFRLDGRPHITALRFEQAEDRGTLVHVVRQLDSGEEDVRTYPAEGTEFRFDLTVFAGRTGD